MDVKTKEVRSTAVAPGTLRGNGVKYLLDACIVLVMCSLLYYGASWQIFKPFTDAAKYQCYGVAFWKGVDALRTFPDNQCRFILHRSNITVTNASIAKKMEQYHLPQPLVSYVASRSSAYRFHALPYEYPLLTIIPFSMGLLAPSRWYQVAFALWMALFALLIYVALARYRSRRAAMAFALYLVVGCWATAFGRFDLVQSALTLFAVMFAVRKRWTWGFVMLALATLLKFYPVVLVVSFFIAQQMESSLSWKSWRRWQPLAAFVAVCAVVMVVSFILSPEGTLGPLGYFGNRPVQVESFSASLMWLTSLIVHKPLTYAFTFGSLNTFGPLGSKVGIFGTLLLGAGLLFTYWLQWKRKIDLATASLLTLLILMVTGKVFSPQYLIWVAPLVAYVGEADYRWLISWSVIGGLTTWIYPYIYNMTKALLKVPYLPLFFPVTTVRNFLLLGFVVILLIYCARRKPNVVASSEDVASSQDVAVAPHTSI